MWLIVLPIVCIAQPIARTSLGPLKGLRVEAVPDSPTVNQPLPSAVDKFLGIPYAVPPVGDLRFKPPLQYATPWTSPRDSTKFGNMCIQESGGSEDCLFLNVYSPAFETQDAREAANLPVMVWIHGGAYAYGSANVYDMTALASCHNVVIVTLNYRLGILGYYAGAHSLASEGTTGNWGQLDQRLSLDWVKREIFNFGGDPGRVTLFGESAGAFSVQWHLVTDLIDETTNQRRGLFKNAIIQSGGGDNNWLVPALDDSVKFYDSISEKILKCKADDLICLREAPAQRFVIRKSDRDAKDRVPDWGSPLFAPSAFGPTIDGKELTGIPKDLAAKPGRINPSIPVILGVNKNEGTLFATQADKAVRTKSSYDGSWGYPKFPLTDLNQINEIVDYFFASEQDRIKVKDWIRDRSRATDSRGNLVYGHLINGKSLFSILSEFLRDLFFHCPTLDWFDALKDNGNPTWLYMFSLDVWPKEMRDLLRRTGINLSNLKMPEDVTTHDLGTFHSSEISLVLKLFPNYQLKKSELSIDNPWGMYSSPPLLKKDSRVLTVSDGMSCYWTNFATCDHPNNCDQPCLRSDRSELALPDWPQAGSSGDVNGQKFMRFQMLSTADPRTAPVGNLRDILDLAQADRPSNDTGGDLAARDTCRLWSTLTFNFRELNHWGDVPPVISPEDTLSADDYLWDL